MRPPAAPRRPDRLDRPDRTSPPAAGREVARRQAGSDRGSDLVLDEGDLDELDALDGSRGEAAAAATSARTRRSEPEDGESWRDVVARQDAATPPRARRLPSLPSVRSLQGARDARSAARRRALRVRIAVVAGVLALLALIGWVVLASPLLALDAESIEVSGTSPYVDPAAVTQTVAAHAGTPLARLDTGAIEAELETMPGIAQATVTRSLPQGVSVTLDPREGVALVPVEGGVELVGADGVVIARLPADQAPVGLPQLAVDTSTEQAGESVNAVLEVLAGLPEDLRAQVAQAGAASPRAISFTLLDGAEVAWGGTQESELKAAVLRTLLQVGAARYDVSEPETPITT